MRRFVMVVSVAVFVIGLYIFWLGLDWLAEPQRRFTLGKACWPCGFTSDGRCVVTYRRIEEGNTGPIEIWDLSTGALIKSILNENQFLVRAELSPDDRWIAIQEGKFLEYGRLSVFDMKSGIELVAFPPAADKVSHLIFDFSCDGKLLAFAGWHTDQKITVWDLERNRSHLVLPGRTPFVFSPDGKHLAVAATENSEGKKGEIRLYELTEGREQGTFQVRKGHQISNISFSPDGKMLCTDSYGDLQTHCCIWDTSTQKELYWSEIFGHPPFLLDGKAIDVYCLRKDWGHAVLDTTNWQERRFVNNHGGSSLPNTVGPKGRTDLRIHQLVHRGPPNPLLDWLGLRNIFPRQTITVEIHDISTGQKIARFPCKDNFATLFLTPDPSMLLIQTRGLDQQDILEIWELPRQIAQWYQIALFSLLTLPFVVGFWIWFRRRKVNQKSAVSEPHRKDAGIAFMP